MISSTAELIVIGLSILFILFELYFTRYINEDKINDICMNLI